MDSSLVGAPPRLVPPPHLWSLGLAPAEGRRCTATVLPLDADLGRLLDCLSGFFPRDVLWIPARDYAHLTLQVTEADPEPFGSPVLPAMNVSFTGVAYTPYGIRLVARASHWQVARRMFPSAPAEPYATVGYAMSAMDAPPAVEVSRAVRALGVTARTVSVERRVTTDGCATFQPIVTDSCPASPSRGVTVTPAAVWFARDADGGVGRSALRPDLARGDLSLQR